MKEKNGAAIDRSSGFGRDAIIFFGIAIAFRALGIIQRAGVMTQYEIISELILPISFCALMILSIVLFGRKWLWTSLLPMVLCALFLVLRALSKDNILGVEPSVAERCIRILIYLVVAMLYSSMVMSEYRIKWALIPIFGLGLLYHFIFEDYPAIINGAATVTFTTVMMELSIIFILLGLLFTALGVKNKADIQTAVEKKVKTAEEKVEKKAEEVKEAKEAWVPFWKRNKVEEVKAEEPKVAEAKDEETKPEDLKAAESKVEEPVPAMAEKPETSAEKAEPEEPAAEHEKPVFDESYFDKPYKPTLTLNPEDNKETDEDEV